MGQLLATLRKSDNKRAVELFLDFENARPSAAEEHVYAQVDDFLQGAAGVLATLRDYDGATDVIKKAIEDPSAADEAWARVVPLILKLEQVYEFSERLANVAWPLLLTVLCSNSTPTPQTLDRHQALTKQLGLILHFVLAADEIKMSNPAIQNDFSYYRRTVSKRKMENGQGIVTLGMCNGNEHVLPTASLFQFLMDTVIPKGNLSLESVSECFSVVAAVCQGMASSPEMVAKFKQADTHMFCLRLMAASIVLYDHLAPCGAFKKISTVDVKSCIKVLREQQPATNHLLNALKYSTKHLNDVDSPKTVRALLDNQ